MTPWMAKLRISQVTETSRWINNDIRPIESGRRTWGFVTFNNYWLLINTNISTYLTGSALIPLGLTWWQAFICIIVGNLLAAGATVLNSLPGAYYHVGYPVINRAVWGMWASQFAVWNRIFLSLVWYGYTAWIGGECVYVILQSWDPNLEAHAPNHMPEDTGMTSANFMAYVIFLVISAPVGWIRPHKLQKFFIISSSVTMFFFLVFLIWSLATMGPEGFGDTINSAVVLPNNDSPDSLPWLMVYGIMSTIGSIAAGILNQNDYARFAAAPGDAILGQAIPFPVYGILSSMIGILVTAATQQRFGGEAIWNPPTLLSQLMTNNPTAGTRAACFFAGLALVISQIGVNVPGNALGGGFDLAATFPKYINIRRGTFITMLFSPIVNPWRLVNTATTFLTVLSSYSVFLGPMTGIMVASYLVVNRRKINVDDLYNGSSSSIYWYTAGLNWRAPVAWTIGVAPCLPGFIAAVNDSLIIPAGLTKLYMMNYLYGFLSSGLVYIVLHEVFPSGKLNTFVKDVTTAQQTMKHYRQKWEMEDSDRHTAAHEVNKVNEHQSIIAI